MFKRISTNQNQVLIFLFLYFVGFSIPVFSVLAQFDSTSDKFGTISIKGGEYIVQNNVWGGNTLQTITVPDTSVCRFNVSKSNHNQDGVASYPSIFKGSHWGLTTNGWQSIRISDLATATFNFTVNSSRPPGKYNVAMEAWFSAGLDTSSGYSGGGELMIWLDSQGMVPAGIQIGTFGSYQVWFAQMDWQYICYFQTGQNSVDINLNDFIQDTLSRGYFNSSWYLHDIEAGFEICSGGEGLLVESFSAEVSKITSSTTPTSSLSELTTTTTPIQTFTTSKETYQTSLSLFSIFLGLTTRFCIQYLRRKSGKKIIFLPSE
jgi:hypothetical protein